MAINYICCSLLVVWVRTLHRNRNDALLSLDDNQKQKNTAWSDNKRSRTQSEPFAPTELALDMWVQLHWPDTGDHGSAVRSTKSPASRTASCACALVYFHPFHTLGRQARQRGHQRLASDIPTAASGSTRARWKPDLQASPSVNPSRQANESNAEPV